MIKTHGTGQSGQVGLVVLLVGAVLMTIGLGVATQSVMEINTANLESDASQAFNAAEQGIEGALQYPNNETWNGDISGYSVNVNSVQQTDNYQGTVLVGHSAQLDMQGVNSLVLKWSDSGCGVGHAAIVVTFIGIGGGSLTRQVYGRQCPGDSFTVPLSCDATSCTVSPVIGGGIAYARIKAVYSDTQLDAQLTGVGLNPQYYAITSTATRLESGEARSVQVNKSAAAVPSIFDYALFSGVDLAQ